MVRTTSARLLMATVSMLALCVSAHAQDATDETPKTTTDQTSDDAAQPVSERTIVLDAISVTASKTGTSVIDAPASISIVDQEELQRRQPDNLGDILRGMPGVEVSGGPRSTVQMPIIRGLTDNRVVIRVDGARANLNVGHKGGLFIDPEVVKQVEVYRGPASTMQGTGALGGVLALTTVDANDMLEPGQNIGARVKAGYTSVDHGMTWNGMAYGRPTDNSDILVSVTRKNTDDFEAGNG
ncbi:TonB-dependent receptor plug domain-containing protein, partial [Thalassospira lucentensis]